MKGKILITEHKTKRLLMYNGNFNNRTRKQGDSF